MHGKFSGWDFAKLAGFFHGWAASAKAPWTSTAFFTAFAELI